MIQQGKYKIHLYFAVYLLLLFKAGFYFIEQSNSITAPLYIAYLLYVALVSNNGRIKVNTICLFVSLALIIIMNLTNLIYGFPAINEYINTFINIITALFFVFIIPRDEFIKAFCDVIFWIGVISIIAWGAMTFVPQVFRFLPSLVNTSNRVGYFCGLTIVSDFRGASAQRTQGLFWEPGAYQCLVVIAMLLEKYAYKPTNKIVRNIVNSVAILLSFSTTGYISLMLVWMILLNKDSKRFHIFRIGLVALLVGYLYLLYGSNLSGQLRYTLSFKIEGMLNYKNATNYAITARADSIFEPLRLYMKSPIIGIGERGYNQIADKVGLATCTPINYLCKYGIIFAAINFYGFYRFIKRIDMHLPELLFILLTLLVSFFSETFFMNPILTIFLLYGYSKDDWNESISIEIKELMNYDNKREIIGIK